MKARFEIEGDLFEDREMFSTQFHALDLSISIAQVLEMIRTRRKYKEISADENIFLESIIATLWVD